ncbi:MAG TPA: hypothetical protein VHM93_22625 [Candidatus Acidoferrum sp.]|jgi:hypothetical protein|nr:hypothetical protein [Candidatus Acidoferrum sp.]
MWIVRGVLLGIAFFISGLVACLVYMQIRIKVAMYLVTHGNGHHGRLPYFAFSTDDPHFYIPFLAAFFLMIAIGLWVTRPRTTRTA